MERKIQQIFLDKNNFIYVVDNTNILYLYSQEDNHFYPFISILKSIKNCFMIDNYFYIHHLNTISVFDENLLKIESFGNNWITQNIDCVCYDINKNIIVTLEHGEVYVNQNITQYSQYFGEEIHRISLSHKYKYWDNKLHLIEYLKFDEIKILDELLLVYKNDHMSIFYLQFDNVKHMININISKQTFDEIYEFNKIHNFFNLQNGNKLTLTGEQHIDMITDNIIFNEQKIYFALKNKQIFCYFNKIKYDTIIKPLLLVLPTIETVITDIDNNHQSIIITLLEDTNIFFITGNISQIIICNNKFFLINDKLCEIILLNETIYYDSLDIYYFDKLDNNLIIDVNITQSITDQLINIIPPIYRLNNNMIYNFEHTDNNNNIISYGEGASRQIYSLLRKELDLILENKFYLCNMVDSFKLGKLMYFCNKESYETFVNIHPYFFYCLSKESDYIILLKKFKGHNYDLYYKQYMEYVNYPENLLNLDMDIKTHHDYIKFLFIADLTEEQICLYNEFVKGFCYFSHRHKSYYLIKNLSIIYYINKLIVDEYFDVKLNFSVKNNLINKFYYEQFCETFKKFFDKLTQQEKLYLIQNITGSQYYSDIINIIFAYDFEEFNILDKKSIYQISTCNAELIVNLMPSEENINTLIKYLIIEDLSMKN